MSLKKITLIVLFSLSASLECPGRRSPETPGIDLDRVESLANAAKLGLTEKRIDIVLINDSHTGLTVTSTQHTCGQEKKLHNPKHLHPLTAKRIFLRVLAEQTSTISCKANSAVGQALDTVSGKLRIRNNEIYLTRYY